MRMGKPTESVLKRSVLIPVSQKAADLLTIKKPGVDSAVLAWDGSELALAQASEVLSAKETLVDEEMVRLCCEKACNNLYAAGAIPVSFQVQLLLPPALEEPEVKKGMRALRAFCDREQITVAGGQTETADAVARPILAISAVGKKSPEIPPQSRLKKVHDGDAIVMSKYLATEGTWRVVKEHAWRMKERFSAAFLRKGLDCFSCLSVKEEAAIAIAQGAQALHDVSRGGLFAALWELSVREGMGFTVDFKAIPVRQETIEYCEVLGINPYCLAGTGSLLMVTADGETLVKALADAGIPAAVIGHMTAGNGRTVVNGEDVRCIEPPGLDEWYRIGADALR